MEYAKIRVLPETPPGGLTAGIDWASTEHVVCVVDAAGRPSLLDATTPHSSRTSSKPAKALQR
jgi:hypothetical protein